MAGIPLRHTEQNTETVMLTVRFPENIERRLDRLARATGRTKSFYMREALLRYLDEVEDTLEAEKTLSRVREGREQVLSSEEVGKMLDGEERGGLG